MTGQSHSLRATLAAYSTGRDDATGHTHTSLAGGKYYIPGSAVDALYDAYAAALQAGEPLALAECHRHVGPVIIDLDLRAHALAYAATAPANDGGGVPQKLYEPRQVARFVNALFSALEDLALLPDGTEAYVLEKPARIKGNDVKDGIHVVLPNVVSRPELQSLLRDDLLPKVATIFCGAHGVRNAASDIYDASVICTAPWLLYGSKKPEETHAWTLTRVLAYDAEGGKAREVPLHGVDTHPAHIVRLLSIRNKYHEMPPLTPAGSERLAAAIKAAEEAAIARQEREEAALAAAEDRTDGDGGGGGNGGSAAHVDGNALAELVDMLAPVRATDYRSWLCTGFCIANITRKSDEGRALFHAFSRKALYGKYDDVGCNAKWRSGIHVRSGPGAFNLDTLKRWARTDNPVAFRAWEADHAGGWIGVALHHLNHLNHRFSHSRKSQGTTTQNFFGKGISRSIF